MVVKVLDVARYLLTKGIPNTEQAITHLKLQKLVYYAQAWHLALLEKPLFDERIEAWVHGPVCPKLYYAYRDYGLSDIDPPKETPNIPPEHKQVIDAVWETYGLFDGKYLEYLTHKEDPWIQARGSLDVFDYSNNVIGTKEMQRYYKRLLEAGDK